MFSYHVYTKNDLNQEVKRKNMRKTRTDSGNHVFDNFYFFSQEHLNSRYYDNRDYPDMFFVAKNDKDQIIGVLLVQKSPYLEKGWWVSYTDVHQKYRKMGIATNLYKTLNEWVASDMILFGSKLSDDGKVAKLHDLRKDVVTKCLTFNYSNDYQEFLKCKA